MPELPDLQVFSHNLTRKLKGKTVKNVSAHSRNLNVSEKEVNAALKGQTVTEVLREGKELFFKFNRGDVLALHLMLKGKLQVLEKENDQKSTIIEIVFTDNTRLVLTDFQKRAKSALNPEKKDATDALSDKVDAEFLKEKLQGTRRTVKSLLMDQHIIRGIGNAYADEILWDARISPMSLCKKIPERKIKDLAKSIKHVLIDAEKNIRKSHPDIISGEVRDFLFIHNPEKKNSPAGAPIEVSNSGSRKTYYTHEQELFK